jgi:hypothetical protein
MIIQSFVNCWRRTRESVWLELGKLESEKINSNFSLASLIEYKKFKVFYRPNGQRQIKNLDAFILQIIFTNLYQMS